MGLPAAPALLGSGVATPANAAPPTDRFNFKRRKGYDKKRPQWRIRFGSEISPPEFDGDVVCRSVADVFDMNVGAMSPFFENPLAGNPSRWGANGTALDFLSGNSEGHSFRSNRGMVHPKLASTLGDIHIMRRDHLEMRMLLDPRITTDKMVQDCYSTQPAPGGGWKGIVKSPIEGVKVDASSRQEIQWKAGLSLVAGMTIRMAPLYARGNMCRSRIEAYDPGTGMLTLQNLERVHNAKGGIHNQMYAIVEAFECGMIQTRKYRPMDGGFIEVVAQPPGGEGMFRAIWLINCRHWGGEEDIDENFDAGIFDKATGSWRPKHLRHSHQGVIRTNMLPISTADIVNYCEPDDTRKKLNAVSPLTNDLTQSYVSFGYERIGTERTFVLDDAVSRKLNYDWNGLSRSWTHMEADGTTSTFPIGGPAAPPHLVINHGIGPATNSYMPKRRDQFPAYWRIKSISFTSA